MSTTQVASASWADLVDSDVDQPPLVEEVPVIERRDADEVVAIDKDMADVDPPPLVEEVPVTERRDADEVVAIDKDMDADLFIDCMAALAMVQECTISYLNGVPASERICELYANVKKPCRFCSKCCVFLRAAKCRHTLHGTCATGPRPAAVAVKPCCMQCHRVMTGTV